jgi:hypothetical protein
LGGGPLEGEVLLGAGAVAARAAPFGPVFGHGEGGEEKSPEEKCRCSHAVIVSGSRGELNTDSGWVSESILPNFFSGYKWIMADLQEVMTG